MTYLKSLLRKFQFSDVDSLESKFFAWACLGIIVCCILMIPQRMYLALSGDELALALNFHERTVWNMLSEPLQFGQMAPLGFVYVTKLITTVWGTSETTFRILPLVGYIALLISIAYFLRVTCKTSLAFTFACVAFTASMSPVFRYGWTFKPYITDCACMFIIAIAYYYYMYEKLSLCKMAILMSASIFFSLPAAFFTGGVVICELATVAFTREFIRFRNALILGACITGSFLLHYFVWLDNPNVLDFMDAFWENDKFAALGGIGKIKEQVDLFILSFGNFGNIFVLASVVESFYCLALFKETERKTILALIFGVWLALFASSIGKYPFADRLFLFLFPLCSVLSFLLCWDILKWFEKTKYSAYVCSAVIGTLPFILLEDWSWYKTEMRCNLPPIRSEWRNPVREIRDMLAENLQTEDVICMTDFYMSYTELFPQYFPEVLRAHRQIPILPPQNVIDGQGNLHALAFPKELLMENSGYLALYFGDGLRNKATRPYISLNDSSVACVIDRLVEKEGKYVEKFYDYAQCGLYHFVSHPSELKTRIRYSVRQEDIPENLSFLRIEIENIGPTILDMKLDNLYLEGKCGDRTLFSQRCNQWGTQQIYPNEKAHIFVCVDWGEADSIEIQLVNQGKYSFSELGIPPLVVKRKYKE